MKSNHMGNQKNEQHKVCSSRRSTSTIARWSIEPLLYQNRVRLVEHLQVHLMNHIVGGENSTRFIDKHVREEWKLKWNAVLRNLCQDLHKINKTQQTTKNDIIFRLNLTGFKLESYINAGFTFSTFLDGLMWYIFYLENGIEVCKLPKQSYLHLLRTFDISDISMHALTTIDNLVAL